MNVRPTAASVVLRLSGRGLFTVIDLMSGLVHCPAPDVSRGSLLFRQRYTCAIHLPSAASSKSEPPPSVIVKLPRLSAFSSAGASTKNSVTQSVAALPPPGAQRPVPDSVQPGSAGKVSRDAAFATTSAV